MDKTDFTNFVDNEISEYERDLRTIQLEIQQDEEIMCLYISLYLKTCFLFNFYLSMVLNSMFDNSWTEYKMFKNAKECYEVKNIYKTFLEDLANDIINSRRLEQITRQDYAELVMIREAKYNINIYGTFIYRSLKRVESLFDSETTYDEILSQLFKDDE